MIVVIQRETTISCVSPLSFQKPELFIICGSSVFPGNNFGAYQVTKKGRRPLFHPPLLGLRDQHTLVERDLFHSTLQKISRLEFCHLSGGNLNLFSSLGISPRPGSPLDYAERSKSCQSQLVSLLQCLRHRNCKGIQSFFSCHLWDLGFICHRHDQIRLRHSNYLLRLIRFGQNDRIVRHREFESQGIFWFRFSGLILSFPRGNQFLQPIKNPLMWPLFASALTKTVVDRAPLLTQRLHSVPQIKKT